MGGASLDGNTPVPEAPKEFEGKEVGVTRTQGTCFRCKKEKEVVLFKQSVVRFNGQTVSQEELWVCRDCLDDAVRERPRIRFV